MTNYNFDKKMLKFILTSIILIPILFIISFIFWGQANIPEDIKINEKICIHFEGSPGSGEHINVFSYNCDSKINWKVSNFGEIKKEDSGILDSTSTMECPKTEFIENKLIFKQNVFCKTFAHQYEDPKYMEFEISEEGKFKLVK